MRKVRIRADKDNVSYIENRFVGYRGEHNATELIIEVPNEYIEAADHFILVFNDGKHSTATDKVQNTNTSSDYAWVEGNEIHCKLWQQITLENSLTLTIEGYKYTPDNAISLIFKLRRIEGLRLRPANETNIDDEIPECVNCNANKSSVLFKIMGDILNLKKEVEWVKGVFDLDTNDESLPDGIKGFISAWREVLALLSKFVYDEENKVLEYDGIHIATDDDLGQIMGYLALEFYPAIVEMEKRMERIERSSLFSVQNNIIEMRTDTEYAGVEASIAYVETDDNYAVLSNGLLEVDV